MTDWQMLFNCCSYTDELTEHITETNVMYTNEKTITVHPNNKTEASAEMFQRINERGAAFINGDFDLLKQKRH